MGILLFLQASGGSGSILDSISLETIMSYAIPVLKGIAVFIIGWMVVGMIVRGLKSTFDKRGMDETAKGAVLSAISIVLKLMVLLAAISTMGVATSSFVAVLGACSLAAGLAFQGSLSNFAGGLLILGFRPFEVGDYIKAQGAEGFVREVQLLATRLESPDNITHVIPNGALSGGNITNVSRQGTLRLHIPVGIGYGESIDKARSVLMKVMTDHPKVLQTPAPSVAVVNLNDSSVDLDLRPYCNAGDDPGVYVDVLEAAKKALDAEGIDIPFPQTVMHNA